MHLPPLNLELSMEQQFKISELTYLVEKSPPDELKKLIVDIYRQKLMTDNVVKSLMHGKT